jgi:hypothetical protein
MKFRLARLYDERLWRSSPACRPICDYDRSTQSAAALSVSCGPTLGNSDFASRASVDSNVLVIYEATHLEELSLQPYPPHADLDLLSAESPL